MHISYQWLQDYLTLDMPPAQVAECLTQAGLEVAQVTPYQAFPKQVVVGHVLTCASHPQADRLYVATVTIGTEEPLTIVCGAPNLAAGQHVAVAPVGTELTLPGGQRLMIEARKLRGILSQGMICAADELGLGDNHDTILVLPESAPIGTSVASFLGLKEDHVLTLELTPNRGDAASHLGVARDLAAATNTTLYQPLATPILPGDRLPISVHVHHTQECLRYTGIVVKGVTVKPSSYELQHRLRTIGVKPINNVVDITNLVMYDLGQPLHAFDYDQVARKKLIIQSLPCNTAFTTLDGVQRTLTGDEIMVCDTEGPLCMGGIMGGMRGRVTQATTTLFLESACFDPLLTAQAARHHKLDTPAAFRFARSTDPNGTQRALQKALQLLAKELSAVPASDVVDHYPTPVVPHAITTSYAYLDRLIGQKLPREEILDILKRLEIATEVDQEGTLHLQVPTYRSQVLRPADIAEEVLRIYGYDRIALPRECYAPYMHPSPVNVVVQRTQALKRALTAQGFHEIKTNAFTRATYAHALHGARSGAPIKLANPLSERLNTLRTNLLFGGLEAVVHNLHRGQTSLKFFEIGRVYIHTQGHYHEADHLALWIAGSTHEEHWQHPSKPTTLQDLTSVVTSLLHTWEIPITTIEPTDHPWYDNAWAIRLRQGNEPLYAGQLKASLAQQADLHLPLFYASFPVEILLGHTPKRRTYTPLPKYPTVVRHLSLALHQGTTFIMVAQAIRALQLSTLQAITPIDCYQGKGLVAGTKAYTIRLTLQDHAKTMQEKAIRQVMDKIIHTLTTTLEVTVRD